jgi:hypothetical protein
VFNPLKRLLLGTPLPSSQAPHERLTKVTGLAVLSSDALSSVAYATDAMLEVLVPAGLLAVGTMRPLAFLIATLLIIVTFSYRQTIHAYPQGGGAYIVAKDNLGVVPGLVAATALMIDYVLTVSVSVAAGVAAVVSAAPPVSRYRVALAVIFIAIIAWGNLRGVPFRPTSSSLASSSYWLSRRDERWSAIFRSRRRRFRRGWSAAGSVFSCYSMPSPTAVRR